MATKTKKQQPVIEEPAVVEPQEDVVSAEEEATSQRSWETVRAQLDAAVSAGAKDAVWKVSVPHVAREVEWLSGKIKQDEGAILERFHESKERPGLEQSFARIGDLARATRYVWRRSQRQQANSQALSGEQYRQVSSQVREHRRVFFAQAPMLVSMGLMEQRELDALRAGSGATDWAQDVEDFVELYTEHWAKIEPLQAQVFAKAADRISEQSLKDAAAAALRLAQHVGRDAEPGALNVDWSAQLKAACHLLRRDWEAILAAAEYHYKRAEQPDKIKELVVPIGAMRRKR